MHYWWPRLLVRFDGRDLETRERPLDFGAIEQNRSMPEFQERDLPAIGERPECSNRDFRFNGELGDWY